MAAFASQEHRPLKKPRLGNVGPDVYPQDPKQKEDELTSISVKHGFSNAPVMRYEDECASAKNLNIDIAVTQSKLGSFFNQILAKKKELNTCQDTGKKKQQINTKDNFWPVTPRSRVEHVEAWFKDLAGNKPLSSLAKKVPIFNKKEEIFMTLCEYNVSMTRAAWFIKMSSAYNVAISESKIKKRQIPDPSLEWTQALTRFLKDQLVKVSEHYHGGSAGTTSFLTAQTSHVDIDLALKHWNYCTLLARHLYQEGLLDRQEKLNWLLEQLEKMKINDDTLLKMVMNQILKYLDEFVQSWYLSRRLAHFCAKRLAQLCNESGCVSPRTQSPMLSTNTNGAITTSSASPPTHNPVVAVFAEYNNCAQHRSLVLNLSAVLQVITLQCPSALVWNSLGEGKSHSMICGSPLDLLPCAPSSLPMPPHQDNPQLRGQVRAAEHQIKVRGRAAEVRWSSDKCQQSTAGFIISKILNVLDSLDRHNFERVELNANMETLYHKVFPNTQTKDSSNEPPMSDDAVVNLLCEWAVSVQRTGEHRAVVVAKLLEKRQNELSNEKFNESEILDEKESVGSEVMVNNGLPPFQNLLMHFLDNQAPVLDDNPSATDKVTFSNLILLFAELIRHDVFSHDAYMCTLISRGDLVSSPALTAQSENLLDLSSIKSNVESVKQEQMQEEMKMELENQNLDSDFDIFASFKDEPKTSPEPPASVKSEKDMQQLTPGGAVHPTPESSHQQQHQQQQQQAKRPARHLQYATHFPIPQDDSSSHECNQRMVVLYGVGKARDEARHVVKKITKEIMKLFSKKNSIDISSGDIGKGKKKKEKEKEKDSDSTASFESTFNKFQKLSYYDQHAVTSSCASSVLEQINSFATGNSIYLPLVDNVSYLFDLMEYSLNVNGLIELAIQLIRELGEVEVQLLSKNSQLAGTYTMSLCLNIIAILRKYHPYLLVLEEQTDSAFDGLCVLVKHVGNPADCTSAERCVLAYLYDLYTSCSYLKTKYSDFFSAACSRVKSILYAVISPSASNLLWDPAFLADLIENPKNKIDPAAVKQLNEFPVNRYSFVCTTLLNICNNQNVERLNELSVLCAELTACCNSLSCEWLGVLKALCCSSNHSCGFIDVLTQIDVGDLSIHDSLAIFTAILIARHCFSLQDLVIHVALPSLLAACPSIFCTSTVGGDQDAEPGARLTCHLLLFLFKTNLSSPNSTPASIKNASTIKVACDRHLLAAAHDSITVGAVVAILKSVLMLGDSCGSDNKAKSGNTTSAASQNKSGGSGDIISTLLSSLDDDDMGMDLMLGTSGKSSKSGMETAGLNEFAKHALKEICSQDWVREKFLKDPQGLFTPDMLLDSVLHPNQAQKLVQLICYPGGVPGQEENSEPDQKQIITRILQNLDQWSLRVSWLELQLMFKQTDKDTGSLLDNIAKATIDVFHQQTEKDKFNGNTNKQGLSWRYDTEKDNMWLVAPLVAKLPSAVQGRVLKAGGQVLENGNNFWSLKNKDKEKNLHKSMMLLNHQPFLSLLLTCLKGQDEQREELLRSLFSQLDKFVSNAKEQDRLPEDTKVKQMMQEALQLRLSLVGGMFETIQRNNGTTTDWAILLLHLISNNVVDTQCNSELFTTVLDMLSVLIHGTLISTDSEKSEDNKKTYHNLIKKLKKELGDKHSPAIEKVRQLLPLPKRQSEVITCEPHGSVVDSKGNKITGFDTGGKKEGLQVSNKVKVSPWDLLEGHKNPAPLSLAWFGAVKLEKKSLEYEQQHRLLLYHTHSLKKDDSYFLDPPPLPPEDLEPPPEKQEEKPVEPMIQEPKVESGGKKPTKKRRIRNARNNQPTTPTYMQQQPGPMRPGMQYNQPSMYENPSHPSNWYNGPQQQMTYYNQPQHLPPGGPQFGNQLSNPKAALRSMVQARQPPNQGYMNTQQPAVQSLQMIHKQQQQLIRQQLTMRHRQNMMNRHNERQGMYAPQGPTQTHMQRMPPQSSSSSTAMQQGYGGYSQMAPQQSSMMETNTSGMMQQNFNQQYQSRQQGVMPGMSGQQGAAGYMQQQAQQAQQASQAPQQAQFNPVPRLLICPASHSPLSSENKTQTGPHESSTPLRAEHTPTQQNSTARSSTPQRQKQFLAVSSRLQHGMGQQGMMQGGPNIPMNSMAGYNQMGPQGGPQAPQQQQSSYMQNIPTPQQQQQQRLQQYQQQQRLLAMQQQQEQQMQQQTQQQQQTAALVAQLQRQLSGGPGQGQPPPQQPPPQYSSYPQPPQY